MLYMSTAMGEVYAVKKLWYSLLSTDLIVG